MSGNRDNTGPDRHQQTSKIEDRKTRIELLVIDYLDIALMSIILYHSWLELSTTRLCWLLGISVPKQAVKSFVENLARYVDKEEKIGVALIISAFLWNGYPK